MAFLGDKQEQLRRDLAEVALGFFKIISDHENRLLSLEESLALLVPELQALQARHPDRIREELILIFSNQLNQIQISLSRLPDASQIHGLFNLALREKQSADIRGFEDRYLEYMSGVHGFIRMIGVPEMRDVKQPLDIAYFSLNIRARAGGGGESAIQPAVAILRDHSLLTIQGPAGSGKTTLLQWIIAECAKKPSRSGFLMLGKASLRQFEECRETSLWNGGIPFFIRLGRLKGEERGKPKVSKFVEYGNGVVEFSEQPPTGWIEDVLKRQKRGVVLFDAVDEIPESCRKSFWEWLSEFIGLFPGNRVIVTSRVIQEPEEGTGSAQCRSWNPPEKFQNSELEDMNDPDIREFIQKWHNAFIQWKQLSSTPDNEAIRDLEKARDKLPPKILQNPDNSRVREICRSPLLCAMTCALHWKEFGYLPRRRVELYKRCCDLLIDERDVKREVDRLDPESPLRRFSSQDKELILRTLAYSMMKNQEKNRKNSSMMSSRGNAAQWIAPVLKNLLSDEEPKSITTAQVLDYLETQTSLLRVPTKGYYDFPHRTFQEYLAACAAGAANDFVDLANRAEEDLWRVTIVLAAGTHTGGEPFGNRLIEALLNQGEASESSSALSLSSLALAVACLETAVNPDPPLRRRALQHLNRIVPPLSSAHSKALSAAGDAVVPHLEYSKWEARSSSILAACAETLALIGSDLAREYLIKGYGSDPREEIVREVLRCPGIHPLEIPAIVKDAARTLALTIPNYARPYLKDLKPLKDSKDLPDLESVDLRDCGELADISGLSSLTALRTLVLADCPRIEDLKPLRGLTQLQTLDLSRCAGIADLSPLENLTSLQSLSLRCCEKVTNMTPLRGLRDLRKLDLANCGNIADLSPLGALVNPRSLDLQGLPKAEYPAIMINSCSQPRPGEDFIETTAGLNLQMVWVPGGTFQMGDNERDDSKPIHEVTLQGFWMAKYQVTQAQYEAIMGNNPSHFKGPYSPVEFVSWEDAMKFCRKLSEKVAQASTPANGWQDACPTYALPSEAQWEYACRARSSSRYCFGDSEDELEEYAWYAKNSEGRTHPVGGKKPNGWGLYDMHGNVWECCMDTWQSDYSRAPTDGIAWIKEEGSYRVDRGGSWVNDPWNCRSASRDGYDPGDRCYYLGFRCCLAAVQEVLLSQVQRGARKPA